MLSLNYVKDPFDPCFKACGQLVAKIYKEKLGLSGFEDADPPDIFFFVYDNEREGSETDKILCVEGIALKQPTFTENNLPGSTEKIIEEIGVKKRSDVNIAESCRTVTRKGYSGLFSLLIIGTTIYLREIHQPITRYVLSSIDPRLVEALAQKAGFPYRKIEGKWDLSKIPEIYHPWYTKDPVPVAVLHDVDECFRVVRERSLKELKGGVEIPFLPDSLK
jgi:hypothetical protein